MKKTAILDHISRKLAPFMFLFGLYLVIHGHLSPGGGFQGGVVIASGVILLLVSHGATTARRLFPASALSIVEAACYILLIALGIAGIALNAGFLGNPVPNVALHTAPRISMFLIMNILIGVKVGAGISLICLRLLGEE